MSPLILRRPSVSAGALYSTTFPATENPMLESPHWAFRGLDTGLDWTNPQTSPGICFGTETGDGGTDDSIALLSGTWANDCDVTGIVHIGTRPGTFSEIELLLRGTISAHSAQLYECYFSVCAAPDRYAHITRWNGAFNSFTDLVSLDNSTAPTLNNGDTIRATVVGTVITVYVNGGIVMGPYDTVGDTTKYASGRPGIGVFSQTHAADSNWGWSSYTARDYGT